jgi:two-component system sensor histidine kinase RegB
LLIDIEDDGPGIPAHVMENMGEPFISTQQGNMGLGIFLANASIQRHNGTIEMYNKPGGGARTLIRVPLSDADTKHGNHH